MSTKISVRRLLWAGGAAALAVLLLLLWAFWPAAPAPVKVATVTPPKPKPVRTEVPETPVLIEDRKEGDVLERLGIDPIATPHCAIINQWHDRRVPMWVILDNMEAQSMMFTVEELGCLTASPTPPGILTWAENHEVWSADRPRR